MNSTTRRAFLRGAPAALAVAAVPAVAAPAPDAELLRLGAEFDRLQGQIDPLMDRFFELEIGDPALQVVGNQQIVLVDQQDAVVDRMKELRATTIQGFQVKAKALRQLYLNNHPLEIEEGCLDEDDALAWTLVRDLLAGGEA